MSKQILLALATIVVLTIAPALIEGRYVNRWGTPPERSVAADRLSDFPKTIGTWEYFAEEDKLPPAVCEELRLAGYINRQYRDPESGSIVRLLLMIGHPGALLRHEPDVCYVNRGNILEGQPIELRVGGDSPNKFRTLCYAGGTANLNRFVVSYSMRTDTCTWDVPYWRRLEFTGASHLYKIQVLSDATGGNFDRAVETNNRFLTQFASAFEKWIPKEPTSN